MATGFTQPVTMVAAFVCGSTSIHQGAATFTSGTATAFTTLPTVAGNALITQTTADGRYLQTAANQSQTGTINFNGNINFNVAQAGNIPTFGNGIANNKPRTAVGAATFSQSENGSSYKIVTIYLSSLTGTASYTFPTAFTNIPAIYAGSGTGSVSSSVVTSVSATAVTITGSSTTGYIELRGV